MGSITLFHGPRAREEGIAWAEATGRLLTPPGGDTLKIEASREMITFLGNIPIGDKIGCLLIGPMDEATEAASDALLKSLEECDTRYVYPAVWATHIGNVEPTIRSRTIEKWCPPPPGVWTEGPYMPAATALCAAALKGRTASVIETLAENEGAEEGLLMASALALLTMEEEDLGARLRLWASIREALRRAPSRRSLLAAFLVG